MKLKPIKVPQTIYTILNNQDTQIAWQLKLAAMKKIYNFVRKNTMIEKTNSQVPHKTIYEKISMNMAK